MVISTVCLAGCGVICTIDAEPGSKWAAEDLPFYMVIKDELGWDVNNTVLHKVQEQDAQ